MDEYRVDRSRHTNTLFVVSIDQQAHCYLELPTVDDVPEVTYLECHVLLGSTRMSQGHGAFGGLLRRGKRELELCFRCQYECWCHDGGCRLLVLSTVVCKPLFVCSSFPGSLASVLLALIMLSLFITAVFCASLIFYCCCMLWMPLESREKRPLACLTRTISNYFSRRPF